MTRRECLLLALFLLSAVSAVTVSGRLLLGQSLPSECIDGVDNDGDGRIDALSTMASDPNATRTWGALGREVMLYMYYELAILPYNSSNTFDDDPATTKKICELAGFKNVQSATKRYFGSCGDNGIYFWNGSAWQLGAACGRDGFVSTLVCQGKFAKCENGVDDDGDGLIDSADTGCASGSDNSEIAHDLNCTSTSTPYELPRQCENGIDDDGDGKIDYPTDPDCKAALDNQEKAECSDTIDNDGDGATDYPADFSCANADDDDEASPKSQCQDGTDNDGDGVMDFPADFSCTGAQDNDETIERSECQDGQDNDTDGAIDYPADFSCANSQDNDETSPKPQCGDGLDNDNDNRADMLDPACDSKQDDNEKSACKDGLDNDNDGSTDYPDDFACTTVDDDNEGSVNAQCQDGIDNDGDGASDYPNDTSCSGKQDNDEKNPIPQCQDGIDNDRDGATDAPNDFSCTSKQDSDETLAKAQCQDGMDNDGDGVFDLADPGCGSFQDNREDDEICKEPLVLIYNLQPTPFTTSNLPKEVTELRTLTYDITYHTRISLPTLQSSFIDQFDIVWLLNGCGSPQQLLSSTETTAIQDFHNQGGHLVLSAGELSGKNATTASQCLSRVDQVASMFGGSFDGALSEAAGCKDVSGTGALLNGVSKLHFRVRADIVTDASLGNFSVFRDTGGRVMWAHQVPEGNKGGIVMLPQTEMLQKSCSENQGYRNLLGMLKTRLGCATHVTQCNDQINNDNENGIDLLDEGCTDAADDSEQDVVTPLQGGTCVIVSADSTGTGQLAAHCPANYVVVGGGWDRYGVNNASNDLSRPLTQGQGWECERNVDNNAQCNAICCSASIIETKIVSVTGPLENHPQPNCPADFTILGGGFADVIQDRDEDILRPEGEDAWHCYDDGSTSNQSQCIAMCGRLKNGNALQCTTEQQVLDAGVLVRCPQGTMIMGGGFLDNTTGNDDTDTNGPNINGWRCSEDNSDSPTAAGACYARCCTLPTLTGSGSTSSGFCGDGIRQDNEICMQLMLCDPAPGKICCPQDCGITSSSSTPTVTTSSSVPATSQSTTAQSTSRSTTSQSSQQTTSRSTSSATTSRSSSSEGIAPSSSAVVSISSSQQVIVASSAMTVASSAGSIAFIPTETCPFDGCAAVGNTICGAQGLTCTPVGTTPCFTCSGITVGLNGCQSDSQCQPWEYCSSGSCVYRITLEVPEGALAICGNRTMEQGEECDDGNARDGDNCSAECLLENGRCGDSVIQRARGEQCEPGLPLIGTVTCSSECSIVSKSCGNGLREEGEECDAGTRNSNAPGVLCRSNCSLAGCGDGIVDPQTETCDDGNRVSTDGCSKTCDIERPSAPASSEGTLSNVITFPLQPASSSAPGGKTVILGSVTHHAPVAETGPGALAVMAVGAASGIAYIRRRRAKKLD